MNAEHITQSVHLLPRVWSTVASSSSVTRRVLSEISLEYQIQILPAHKGSSVVKYVYPILIHPSEFIEMPTKITYLTKMINLYE